MDSSALLWSYFSLMLVAIWLHWWIYGDIQGYLIDSQNDILNLFDINVEYSLKGLVIGSYVLISFLIFFFLYQSGVNYLNNLSKRLFSFCMWLFVIAIIWIRVKIDIFSVGAFALPLSVYLTYTIKNIGNVHIKRVIVGVLIVFLVFCATIHYWI